MSKTAGLGQSARGRSPLYGRADLHVHTTHSDGVCSPGEVVWAAANVGLSALAITDHDTLSAIPIAAAEAVHAKVECIAGVELTSEYEGREIHLLGYFVDPLNPALVEACRDLRERRAVRLDQLTESLVAEGLRLDTDALRRMYPYATLGRKHLANYLARTGQIASPRVAFERWLGDHGGVRVPKPRVPWKRALGLIRDAGGVSSWAHPPGDAKVAVLEALVSEGLTGIEACGPGLSPARRQRLGALAERFALIPTAGSDFHASDRPGRWLGNVSTSAETLARLRECAAAANRTETSAEGSC